MMNINNQDKVFSVNTVALAAIVVLFARFGWYNMLVLLIGLSIVYGLELMYSLRKQNKVSKEQEQKIDEAVSNLHAKGIYAKNVWLNGKKLDTTDHKKQRKM